MTTVAISGIGEAPVGRFPDRPALTVALDVAREAIDDAGIGPFETVPADGVSDDLLRRYLRMWAPEVGELS